MSVSDVRGKNLSVSLSIERRGEPPGASITACT